jgi:cyclopropane fatty-acyl-phospholipid synthase-like methyltransferase
MTDPADYLERRYEHTDPWAFETSAYERQKYDRQLRAIDDRVEDPDRILELGSAEGAFTSRLADEFPSAEIHGVEFVSEAVQRARARLSDDSIRFFERDLEGFLTERTETYDVIVWSETIYYVGANRSLPDLDGVVRTVADRLAADGLLCMANIVDQEGGYEEPLTRRPMMNAYYELLAGELTPLQRAVYHERKAEMDERNEYQIWVFGGPEAAD